VPSVHFSHRVFGLEFQSEFELPELEAGQGHADVQIAFGDVMLEFPKTLNERLRYQSSPERLLLQAEGTANYLVDQGTRILVDTKCAVPELWRLLLYSNCMAALLQQRGIVPLHSSVVLSKLGALLIAGPSGAGKSTLAGALADSGFPVVADDIGALSLDSSGRAQVALGIRRLRLAPQALKQLNLDANRYPRTLGGAEKFEIPPSCWPCTNPPQNQYPIAAVIFLSVWDRPDFRTEAVSGANKVQLLLHHTYRDCFLSGAKSQQDRLKLAYALAAQVPMFSISRPSSNVHLSELLATVQSATGCRPPS
jgi:hypothetical protein